MESCIIHICTKHVRNSLPLITSNCAHTTRIQYLLLLLFLDYGPLGSEISFVDDNQTFRKILLPVTLISYHEDGGNMFSKTLPAFYRTTRCQNPGCRSQNCNRVEDQIVQCFICSNRLLCITDTLTVPTPLLANCTRVPALSMLGSPQKRRDSRILLSETSSVLGARSKLQSQ